MRNEYAIGAYGDVSNTLHDYVRERARVHIVENDRRKAGLTTPAEVRARQRELREWLAKAIGGIPDHGPDGNPVWGKSRLRGAYSVQNVLFRAAPNVFVPATVWRPARYSGKRPGVLFCCGHHEQPREVAEYQEVCATFAVNGYVTLAFDPPGQGELKLCWDPALGASAIGRGSLEHEHFGTKCELLGFNIARYFVQNGMASFDLLASLPEVDPGRIAVTGNSGGGTQSSLLMVADERIAAAMPCTFTTSREIYMRRPHWHDEEQNLAGALPAGMDYDDFYLCFAPKPAAIGAVTWDFFPIEGTRSSFEKLRHVYAVLGAADSIALHEVESDHQYHPELRRHAVEFFNRFLQKGEPFRALEGFVPEDPASQRATPSGQVSVDFPDVALVHEQNTRAAEIARGSRGRLSPKDLRVALGIPVQAPARNQRVVSDRTSGDVRIRKLFVFSEPDIPLPVTRITGPRPQAGLLYCCDDGVVGIDANEEELLRRLALSGFDVCVLEPRGIGETRQRPLGPIGESWGETVADRWICHHLRMLGTSLGALQAYDVAAVLGWMRASISSGGAAVIARGMLCWSVAIGAALYPGVRLLCLDGLRPSIESFVTQRTASIPQAYAIPGILALADIPQIVGSAGAPGALILDPVDSLGRRITAPEWEQTYRGDWADQRVKVSCTADSVARRRSIVSFLAPGTEGRAGLAS